VVKEILLNEIEKKKIPNIGGQGRTSQLSTSKTRTAPGCSERVKFSGQERGKSLTKRGRSHTGEKKN